MSSITFQFGQCGNQVGQSFYTYIYNDIFWDNAHLKNSKTVNNEYINCSKDGWFTTNKKNELSARSILIDTENKVTFLANKNIPYKFKNIVSGAYGGSANNWACGYHNKSLLLIGEILEKTRVELEKCDFVKSFISLLGAGGGTGSGLGCFTIEKLKEEYPSKFFINCLVLPHEKGEVVTQNYNALLTLANLYDIADANVLFSNDLLFKICSKNLNMEDADFSNFNYVIAQQMAGIFQPIHDSQMPEPLINLISHPQYKFLSTYSAPFIPKEHLHYETAPSYNIIMNQIERSLQYEFSQLNKQNNNFLPTQIRCIGNAFFTRGNHETSKKNFLNEKAYVNWIPRESRLAYFNQKRCLKDIDLSTTVISNNNNCSYYLNSIISDAWTLFTNGAYVHHYKKFGTGEHEFLKAFEKLEDILSKYISL